MWLLKNKNKYLKEEFQSKIRTISDGKSVYLTEADGSYVAVVVVPSVTVMSHLQVPKHDIESALGEVKKTIYLETSARDEFFCRYQEACVINSFRIIHTDIER